MILEGYRDDGLIAQALGRLVVAWLMLVAGALPAGMFLLAAVLGSLFVAECVMSWVRLSAGPVSVYEDEEDEGQ